MQGYWQKVNRKIPRHAIVDNFWKTKLQALKHSQKIPKDHQFYMSMSSWATFQYASLKMSTVHIVSYCLAGCQLIQLQNQKRPRANNHIKIKLSYPSVQIFRELTLEPHILGDCFKLFLLLNRITSSDFEAKTGSPFNQFPPKKALKSRLFEAASHLVMASGAPLRNLLFAVPLAPQRAVILPKHPGNLFKRSMILMFLGVLLITQM